MDGHLVLTAAHSVSCKKTGEPAASVKVLRATDGAIAAVGTFVTCMQLDIAILELEKDVPWQNELPAVVFARVDRRHSGILRDCEAIGYPLFQRDPIGRARHTSEVHGTIYPTDGAESGRLLIRDPLIQPGREDVEYFLGQTDHASSGGDLDPSWNGLSGASVFCRGHALGVIIEHRPAQGNAALQAVAFDTVAASSDPDARRIAKALKLPNVDQLAWLGTSGELIPSDVLGDAWTSTEKIRRTERRRVVGERISASVDVFRDRVTFRADFRELLLTRKYPIVSITGRRGIGKSGLVAKVLAEFEDENSQDADTIGGIAYLSTRTGVGILDLARVFHALAALLGGEDRERLEALWNNLGREAVPELLAAAQGLNMVVVLDNLDDLQDPVTGELKDSALTSFLSSVCRNPRPPVIVTTSQKPLKLSPALHSRRYGIEIDDGIEMSEAIAYVREADVDGAAGLRDAPQHELVRLIEQVHRVPRGLELLVSLLADDPARALNPFSNAETSAEAALLALVTEGFESLGEVERAVVQHLALANAPVPAQALGDIMADIAPRDAVNAATNQLVRKRMVGADRSGTVRLHPVDTDFVARSLAQHPALKSQIDLRLAEWLASQGMEPSLWRTSTDVSPQRREIRHRLRAGDVNGAIRRLYQIAEFLVHHGEADRVRQILQGISRPLDAGEVLARYQHIQGLVEFYDGKVADALGSFREAGGFIWKSQLPLLKAQADLWYGTSLRSAGSPEEAIKPLENAIRLAGAMDDGRLVLLEGLLQLTLSQCYAGRYEDAMRTADVLERSLGPSDTQEARALLYDAKALVFLGLDDLTNALDAVEKGIESYTNSPQAPAKAYLVNVRGLVHLIQADVGSAIADFKEAIDEAARYGETRLEGMSLLNLAWAHLFAGSTQLSKETAGRAETRLLKNGLTAAASATELINASGAEDEQSMFAHLLHAKTHSRGNPDLCQPAREVLAHLASKHFS